MLTLLLTHWPIVLITALLLCAMIYDLKLDLLDHELWLASRWPDGERRGK
jgi:hypothetical protein